MQGEWKRNLSEGLMVSPWSWASRERSYMARFISSITLPCSELLCLLGRRRQQVNFAQIASTFPLMSFNRFCLRSQFYQTFVFRLSRSLLMMAETKVCFYINLSYRICFSLFNKNLWLVNATYLKIMRVDTRIYIYFLYVYKYISNWWMQATGGCLYTNDTRR